MSFFEKKKNEKLCQCGVFPCQVLSFWDNSLHKSLHKNLNKHRFKTKGPINIINRIDEDGLLYNIIKCNRNCDNRDLIALNNTKDFIKKELDFSKKIIETKINDY